MILETILTPGSIIITYNLYSNKLVNENISMSFVHTLETLNRNIDVTTGVTINNGNYSGATSVILIDENYNSLINYTNFSSILVKLNDTIIDLNIIINQPIYTPEPTQQINDSILLGNNFYLKIKNNEYVRFINP